jgi:acetamidase/formamidase
VCSVVGDPTMSEVVDAPIWIVSMHMPVGVQDGSTAV